MSIKEQRRKAFEKWAITTIGQDASPQYPEWAIEKNSLGNYAATKVHGAWLGYNAALDSVVIELPDWSSCDTPRQALDACREELEFLGLKVKP